MVMERVLAMPTTGGDSHRGTTDRRCDSEVAAVVMHQPVHTGQHEEQRVDHQQGDHARSAPGTVVH